MALTLADGVIDYRGSLIPNLFTKFLIKNYYDHNPLPKITNSNGTGEIKTMGDKVTFRKNPTITVSEYVKGASITYPELAVDTVDLEVDKSYSFTFSCHDYTKAQTDLKNHMQQWVADGNEAMAEKIGTDFFQNMIAEVHASNTGVTAGSKSGNLDLGALGDPVAITSTNAMRTLLKARTALNELSVPMRDRWAVVPPSYSLELFDSDLKKANEMGDGKSVIRQADGYGGYIAGFHVIESNWLPTGASGEQYAFFGQKDAIAFVTQFTKSEWLRDKDSPEDYFRAFNLSGYKAIKPEALGCIIFSTAG